MVENPQLLKGGKFQAMKLKRNQFSLKAKSVRKIELRAVCFRNEQATAEVAAA
jgi:hypothetical protein